MRSRSSSATVALFGTASALLFSLACGATTSGSSGDEPAELEAEAHPGASRSGTDGAIGDGTSSALAPADEAAPPPRDAGQDAGPPAVRFIGRFDATSSAGPTCAWPGCRIIANFSGTAELAVRLDEHVEAWMEGGPSEWDVLIDGVLRPKLVLTLGVKDYVLASDLSTGPHRVELYKRTEAQNGYTRFLGYDFGGGQLLSPPPVASRRLEFVGDSGPAAFGIEGVGQGDDCPGPNWAARWQNFHRSMVAHLGEALTADVHGTIYSGKGLVRNIWRADPDTMPLIYPRANPLFPGSTFDFTTFVPDVFVVMMGGNDFALGQPVDDGPTPLPEFTQALRDLVATFRSRSTQAHVFLAVSPSVSDAEPAGRATRTNVQTAFDAVAVERNQAGDARVFSVAPPAAAPSELTGCEGHGNPAYHARVAQQLSVMIKAQTGW